MSHYDGPVISVEYETLAGIQVNVETGEIVDVIVWSEEFNTVKPERVYAGGYEGPDAEGLPEYLPEDHPLYKKAMEIANKVHVRGVCHPHYEVSDE